MPELSDILKGAVSDVPDFDPVALVTRRRRQRRVQAAGATSVLLVIATAIVLLLNTGGGGVVVSTRQPAATATESSASTTSSAATLPSPVGDTTVPSTIPPTGTTGTSTTTIPGTRPPQIGDFTGTLTASGATVHVGEGIDLELRVHNASADVIDTSRDERPTTFELYCDVIQNPGPPEKTGVAYYDGWFLPESSMQPGADGAISGQFVPSSDFIGRATCQAVVMKPSTLPRFFPTWEAITAIDPVVITVLPADGATTTIVSTVPPRAG